MGFSLGKVFKKFAAPAIGFAVGGPLGGLVGLNFAKASEESNALKRLAGQLGPSPQERELLALLVRTATRAEALEKELAPQIQEALEGQLLLKTTGQDIAQRALTGGDITEIPGVEAALNQFENQAIQQFGPGFLQSEAGIRAREAFKERIARVALGFRGGQIPLPTSGATTAAAAPAFAAAGQLQGRTALATSVREQARLASSPFTIFDKTLGQLTGFAKSAAPFLGGGGGGSGSASAGGFGF